MIVAVRGIPVVNKPVDVHERAPVGSVPNQQRQEDDSVATHVAYQGRLDIDRENAYQDQDGAFLASKNITSQFYYVTVLLRNNNIT